MKAFESTHDFRCLHPTNRILEGGKPAESVACGAVAKHMWLSTAPFNGGIKELDFVVECFEGHISYAKFKYVEAGPRE